MSVWVNGELTDTRGATTVSELAAALGLLPRTVLIEHNAVALHQREWPTRTISDGDRLEFVRVVAGG